MDLKPCPFCGGPAKLIPKKDGWKFHCTNTRQCPFRFEPRFSDKEAAAIVWNSRKFKLIHADVKILVEALQNIQSMDCGEPSRVACVALVDFDNAECIAEHRCHVCGVGIGEKHLSICSVSPGFFRR